VNARLLIVSPLEAVEQVAAAGVTGRMDVGVNALYLWLAIMVAVVHGVLVAAVCVGTVAAMAGVLRRHAWWEKGFYLLLAGLLASELLFGMCFLTLAEQALREWHQPGSAYHGSYIGHYLPWLLFLVRGWISIALLVAAVLAGPFWRWRDRRR
jgi:hypothetical protein